MHVGLGLQFANLDHRLPDGEVYNLELGLGARAEAAGFDSVFVSEHHFANYQMTSQQSMVLAWLAAQTERIKLGTFVTVLPWNDPVRVAESFTVLDHMSGGRGILGLGRGLGQKEFVGFRVEMGQSRQLFKEYSHALLDALDTGVMQYDGELYKQPPVEIRPEPMATYRGRTFASAVSPESMEIMARMGVGLMVIAQKPWETTEAELEAYRKRYLELQGHEAPKPLLVVVAAVSEDPAQVDKMRNVYLQRWARSTVEHYEFDNEGFANIEGYEYYAALAANINKHGLDKFNGFLADLQVWGTPEQVTEKLLDYVKRTDAGGVVCPVSFGGMTPDEAKANFELFATKVRPELQRHDVGGDLGVTYDVQPTAVA